MFNLNKIKLLTKLILLYYDINKILKIINIIRCLYHIIMCLLMIIIILLDNTWLINYYPLFFIENYMDQYDDSGFVYINTGPTPPPIGGGWGPTPGGGGGIPPFESFHAYLAASDSDRHTVKVDIDRAFPKYFARAYGTKLYTELGLKGPIEFKQMYDFVSAEITFIDKTKITIYDEYTFCRYVLAHRYVVTGQHKDYIKFYKRSTRAYEKEKMGSTSSPTTSDISINNLLNHDDI